MIRPLVLALATLALGACARPSRVEVVAQPAAPHAADCGFLQPFLDSVHSAGRFPGATLGVAFPDGSSCGIATGWSDTARRVRMEPTHLLLAGSVGKTFFGALALQLAAEGRLDLDAPISKYLGDEPWFTRLPNARFISVRQLMNHTSGLVRYELQPRFLAALHANPDTTWTAATRLAFLLDSLAPFAAGTGFHYSDSNYIVLGLILERVMERDAYAEIRRRITEPLGLARTVPSDRRVIPGLSQGYAGANNPFIPADAMIQTDGRLAVNPQFEWAGGGYATAAEDLARWTKLLYEGRAYPDTLLRQVIDGVDASSQLGRGVRYGLTTIIRASPLGVTYGHSGFMPGYVTDTRYWPEHRVAVALQVNTSAPGALGRAPGEILTTVARRIVSRAHPR